MTRRRGFGRLLGSRWGHVPHSLLKAPAAPSTGCSGRRGRDLAAHLELFLEHTADREVVTPLRVQTKRFRRAWCGRGYAAREVDAYLNQVAEELVRLHRQLQQVPPTSRTREPAHEPADPQVIGRVLVLAVKTADRLVAQAWVRAADIVERAHQQAQEIVEDARTCSGQTAEEGGSDAVVLPGPWRRSEGGGHDQKGS